MTTISDEKYVSLTTYKRDGSAKSLPVWIADFGDGTIGFTTSGSSYKVKRINNDPRVTLRPSNAKGEVEDGAVEVTGTAVVVEGPEFEPYAAKVRAKYGIQYRAITLFGKLMNKLGRGSGTNAAVVITLD
ncbi:MAG: PPOX class F420-dependent oxidoreductase [Actinomycetota bacterium]